MVSRSNSHNPRRGARTRPIRVLIAEDSATTRAYIVALLEGAGDFEVAGTAMDGAQAVAMVPELCPDMVLMDVHMPRMDGFEATRRIMETHPLPIVIFSVAWDPRDAAVTFQAIQAGALTALAKPAGPGCPDAPRMVQELLQTLRLMADVPVVRRFARSLSGTASNTIQRIPVAPKRPELIAIGASTGGPPVLRTILTDLPMNMAVPVLVVQHISIGFLTGLVEWLNRDSACTVCIATHREPLRPGHIYLAPDNLHMGVTGNGHIELSDSPPENNLRPSVDHLFRSVAAAYGDRATGILLTGMGKDGARELKTMRDAGCLTIVQDEASSVVFGMPGAAIDLGAAKRILTPGGINRFLKELTT